MRSGQASDAQLKIQRRRRGLDRIANSTHKCNFCGLNERNEGIGKEAHSVLCSVWSFWAGYSVIPRPDLFS